MKKPKVSILVPVYGVEKYIEKCARSLFEQTYQNIEYIFVNDCTKDKSITLLKRILTYYPHRVDQVKIINHEINKGLSASRNTCMRNSTGEYIMHVDSDDYLELDAVNTYLKIVSTQNVDIVVSNYNCIYGDSIVKKKIELNITKDEYINKLLTKEIDCNIWGCLYKKSLYIENEINNIEHIDMAEDYMIKPCLVYYSKCIGYVNEYLYNYRCDNVNSYSNNISKKAIDNISDACLFLKSFFKEKSDSCKYMEALDRMDTINMLYLIEQSRENDFQYICDRFPVDFNKSVAFLPVMHRITFILLKYKLTRLLCFYLDCGCLYKIIRKYYNTFIL